MLSKETFRIVLYAALLVHPAVLNVLIDNSIARSNIYYQEAAPFAKGFLARERAISDVEKLESKEDFKVIIHGYLANRNHSSITPLKYAYLSQGKRNILMADWGDAAQADYAKARRNTKKVSIFLAKLLENFINKHEIDRSQIQIIGHSLGAHIAGNIGKYFNGSLGRITGLDPALPLFTPTAPDSLKPAAGRFVDVIHTDYPIFGDLTPRGTIDFYPNYGYAIQRGCEGLDFSALTRLIFKAYSCSHNRAVLLYAESINIPLSFPTLPCSLNGIQNQNVSICYQKLKAMNISLLALNDAISTQNETLIAYMGERASPRFSGIHYLATSDAPPYGYGSYTQFL